MNFKVKSETVLPFALLHFITNDPNAYDLKLALDIRTVTFPHVDDPHIVLYI